METQTQIFAQIEALLQQLKMNNQTPFILEGPVGTVLEILSRDELTATSRLVLLYMVFARSPEDVLQREIAIHLGITNKGVRECLEALAMKGYVKRGIHSGSWNIK